MTWWQIVLLIVGILWVAGASGLAALALTVGRMFQAGGATAWDWIAGVVLYAIGPAMIFAAVAT